MRYESELDVKQMLGIETWKNLSKDKLLQFLEAVPEIDREVALQLVRQIPEITACAKVALEDAAEAYAGLLSANAQNMAALHELDLAVLDTLRNELSNDLTVEERMWVLGEIRDWHARTHLKDTENKAFLSAQFDKRLAMGLTVAGSVAVLVLGVASRGMSGGAVLSLKAA